MQNELRGGLDGWDFKNYILGFLFYRFIGDDFAQYIDRQNGIDKEVAADDPARYHNLEDSAAEDWKEDLVEEKGFFIYPSQLFENVVKKSKDNEDLNEELAQVFTDIEHSSAGTPSEDDFKNLFIDLDINSTMAAVPSLASEYKACITKAKSALLLGARTPAGEKRSSLISRGLSSPAHLIE